jgi:ubiquinol-cytochrome c reductase cytochrome c1 subunit
MNRILAPFALLAALLLGTAPARAEEAAMDHWPSERAHDLGALQSGARTFANYCLNCHSANLMRWNRLHDIGLDDRQIKDFLIFGNQKVGDLMTIALNPKDAKAWFGKVPPDLSLITRARTSFEYAGTDYIYTLLRGYYRDRSSPTGWNNVAYPNIAMPNIFWEQGPREATITRVDEETPADGKGKATLVKVVSVYDGAGNVKSTRTELEHGDPAFDFSFKPADEKAAKAVDDQVADLVAYLAWMSEPAGPSRVRIGVWALIFLGLFTVVAWRLNAAYWKDVK